MSIIQLMITEKKHKIIEAAHSVFLRYGYKRVTMNDIAEAAEISRPAIYLLFPNKEEVFKSVIKHMAETNLNEIRKGIATLSSPEKKLKFAFEIWAVRPFELIKSSPDASELTYFGHQFSREVFDKIGAAFEMELVSIIEPHMKSNTHSPLSAKKTAQIMRGAIRGFKEMSHNSSDLRQMIKDFLDIILSATIDLKQTKAKTEKAKLKTPNNKNIL